MKKMGIAGLALVIVGALVFGAGFIGARGDLSVVNGSVGPFRVQLADGHVHSGFSYTNSGDSSQSGIGGGRNKPVTTPPVPTPMPTPTPKPDSDNQRFKGTDVRKVNIDINYADVVLYPTDAMYVYVLSEDLDDFRIELDKKGTLSIESRDKVTLFGIGLGDSRPTLTVALPAELGSLEVEVSCGDIELEDLSLGEVELSTDMGDVYVNGIQCRSVELSSDCGSVEAQNVISVGKLSADSDMGDVTVENSQAGDKLSAESSCGKITVTDCTAGNAELSSDMGDVKAARLACIGSVKLDCDCGAIKFSALSAGKSIEIKNSMGSIDGTLAGRFDDYSIESGTDLGSNNLPGELRRNGVELKVFTSCGSIDIDFEED